MTGDRDSVGSDPTLLTDPDEIARQEAANAIRQFDGVLDLIDEVARDGRAFRLKPSTILQLHRFALDGLSKFAGTWRTAAVTIGKSQHVPPHESRVPALVEEMCDWVNENWAEQSALMLCSYVMWRLNWIHPFSDGNGRTSRAVSYLVLCAKLGDRLPGRVTIPEQIASNKAPYYDALEALDASEREGALDLTPMKTLVESYLAKQLSSVFEHASRAEAEDNATRKLH